MARINELWTTWPCIGRPGGWHFTMGLLALVLCCGFAQEAVAQEEASVVVDRNPVVAGQAFRITFVFKGVNAKFQNPPSINGLRYISGPSTSTSTQIINGAMTSERSYAYSAVISSVGNFRIPAFTFKSRNGDLRTKPINLRVVKPGSKEGQPPAKFEAVIEVDKRRAHLGEPIRVQYRILNRMDALDVRNYTFPELTGVWKETVSGEDPRWENTIIGGQRVQVATVRTDILYPTQTGDLVISGFDVDAQTRISFFNTRPVAASASPVTIAVSPLPTPVPATSLGTFQNLSTTWKTEGQTQPTANEAINLKLEFRGNGNLGLIGAPEIQWPKDLEVFDPEIQDRITTDLQGQRGRRSFTYLVIPRAPGQYSVSLPELSYFDYTLDRFVSLNVPPISLDVVGNAQSEGPSFGFNSKTDVTILTRDMRFIRTETKLKPKSMPFYGGPFHMALLGLPPIALLLGWLARRKKDKESRDPALQRKRATKAQFKAAIARAKKGDNDLDALGQAAHNFLQGQLGIKRSDAGMDAYRLGLSHLAPERSQEWTELIGILDRGRFAPGAPKPADIAERLESAAKSLEREDTSSSARSTASAWALVLVSSALLATPCMAAPDANAAQTSFAAGNAAYLEGDFEAAIAQYEEVAAAWTSFELEYNLGVAYYKSGRIGPSILHFERAKRFRPSDDDLQANMLLARAAVVDRIEAMPEIALGPLWRELTSAQRLTSWTFLSIALWALAFCLFYFRMASKDTATRRTLIVAAPALGAMALLVGFLGHKTHELTKSNDGAVLMSPRVEVMSGPSLGDESSMLFVLHEGTVVQVLRSEGTWRQVRLANGNAGWVPSDALVAI